MYLIAVLPRRVWDSAIGRLHLLAVTAQVLTPVRGGFAFSSIETPSEPHITQMWFLS